MKKALRGLKNQMFVNDYWKNIINEIILIKESDLKIEDSAILFEGGGSEPCLKAMDNEGVDLEEDQYVRRAVSTSDLQDQLNSSFQLELEERPKQITRANSEFIEPTSKTSSGSASGFRVSPNFLAVPGGHQRTRAVSPCSASTDSTEELNDDTITSLRQFMQVAKIAQPVDEWVENNIPHWAGDSKKSISRTVSLDTNNQAVNRSKPVERRPSVRSNLSRNSTRYF